MNGSEDTNESEEEEGNDQKISIKVGDPLEQCGDGGKIFLDPCDLVFADFTYGFFSFQYARLSLDLVLHDNFHLCMSPYT